MEGGTEVAAATNETHVEQRKGMATPVVLAREHAFARALAHCVVCAMTSSTESLVQLQPLYQMVLPSCRLSGCVPCLFSTAQRVVTFILCSNTGSSFKSPPISACKCSHMAKQAHSAPRCPWQCLRSTRRLRLRRRGASGGALLLPSVKRRAITPSQVVPNVWEHCLCLHAAPRRQDVRVRNCHARGKQPSGARPAVCVASLLPTSARARRASPFDRH